MDYPDGTRRVEIAKEQRSRDAQQAELLIAARVAVFDTKKAELVAQRILAQHSIKMKVALSELVLQTAEDLRSQEIKPKDRALALVALKTVSNQLYGWDREPDIDNMKLARRTGDSVPTAAVNLRLINTTPQELAAMAKAQSGRDVGEKVVDNDVDRDNGRNVGDNHHTDDHTGLCGKKIVNHDSDHTVDRHRSRDDHCGSSASECNASGTGPSTPVSAQAHTVTHGLPIPGSPEWNKLRLQELDRLRTEWRRRRS